MTEEILSGDTVLATMGIVDHFYMLRIVQPLPMPCGAQVRITGRDQLCPNSGNCTAGHKACWVEKYDEQP